jgi:hypothetical protein
VLAQSAVGDWRVTIAKATMEIWAASGAHLMAEATDMAVTHWGALDGVIHVASIPGGGEVMTCAAAATDATALRQTDQEVRAIIAPRADGLAIFCPAIGRSTLPRL